ncbi:MAG: cytochrome c-type biogenesis CcmF C-terminal domain-containing protein, partial [Pseudomonadota bacterium]
YYELGWGGWWFWDPVENASFMPWLAATALFHSAIVAEKRGELKNWTILLAIIGFSLSLLGTFIVRSGLLTSVHAFASDPTRGMFVLGIWVVAVGGALALYAWRSEQMASDGVFTPISREGALLLNNLLLAVSCVAVFAGTMAPVLYEAFGRVVTVGPPFFDLVFGALMIPLLLALPVGAMLPWKRGDLAKAMGKLWALVGVSLAVLAGFFAVQSGTSLAGPVGVALSAWVVLGALYEVADRARIGRAPLADSWRRLRKLPRSDWGKTLGHLGVGLMVFGIAASTALQTEDRRLIKPGERYETSGHVFQFAGVEDRVGPNFDARTATVHRLVGDRIVESFQPEARTFRAQPETTQEVGLSSGFAWDVYIVLGDPKADGSWTLYTYVKPFVSWIWIGALVMSLGAAVSLTDNRHRVGAPAARRNRRAPTARRAPAATPAE